MERSTERNWRNGDWSGVAERVCACGANEPALAAAMIKVLAHGQQRTASRLACLLRRFTERSFGSTEGREGHEVGPPNNSAGAVFSTRRLNILPEQGREECQPRSRACGASDFNTKDAKTERRTNQQAPDRSQNSRSESSTANDRINANDNSD